jgi:hypothetical protein
MGKEVWLENGFDVRHTPFGEGIPITLFSI